MPLRECRRYPTLPQALVARSALEASGLRVFVFDEFRASMMWTQQFALGGVRLMVLASDVDAARELLADVGEAEPKAAEPLPARITLFLSLLALSFVVGWPIAGFKRNDLFHRVTALALTFLFAGITLWVFVTRAR